MGGRRGSLLYSPRIHCVFSHRLGTGSDRAGNAPEHVTRHLTRLRIKTGRRNPAGVLPSLPPQKTQSTRSVMCDCAQHLSRTSYKLSDGLNRPPEEGNMGRFFALALAALMGLGLLSMSLAQGGMPTAEFTATA